MFHTSPYNLACMSFEKHPYLLLQHIFVQNCFWHIKKIKMFPNIPRFTDPCGPSANPNPLSIKLANIMVCRYCYWSSLWLWIMAPDTTSGEISSIQPAVLLWKPLEKRSPKHNCSRDHWGHILVGLIYQTPWQTITVRRNSMSPC